MTMLNWFPEIVLFVQLLFILGLSGFRLTTSHVAVAASGIISLFAFLYYGFREDLFLFDAPLASLLSDPISRYFRWIVLFGVSAGCWQFGFHTGLSVKQKYRGVSAVVLGGFFTCFAAQSNHFLGIAIGVVGLLMVGWIGILVETHGVAIWFQRTAKAVYSALIALTLFLLIYAVSVFYVSSGNLSDFYSKTLPEQAMYPLGMLVLSLGLWMLHGFHIIGEAPVSLARYHWGVGVGSFLVWTRLVIPYFVKCSEGLGSDSLPGIQMVLGLAMGSAAIRYSILAARTREPSQWLSGALPALSALSLFPLLLKSQTALSIAFSMGFGLVLVYSLLGRAFLGVFRRNRWFSVVAVLSAVGFPPLTLGFQYFRALKELHQAHLGGVAVIFLLSWFLIAISAVQMITQLLVRDGTKQGSVDEKVGDSASPVFSRGVDWAMVGTVVLCVILMTAFGEDILQRLNTQPVAHLW